MKSPLVNVTHAPYSEHTKPCAQANHVNPASGNIQRPHSHQTPLSSSKPLCLFSPKDNTSRHHRCVYDFFSHSRPGGGEWGLLRVQTTMSILQPNEIPKADKLRAMPADVLKHTANMYLMCCKSLFPLPSAFTPARFPYAAYCEMWSMLTVAWGCGRPYSALGVLDSSLGPLCAEGWEVP